MIELKGISRTLGAFSLRDISFAVDPGTYFVLLGESGAGKSVLLEIIAGLRRPDRGSVHFNGREITRDPIQHRGFGLVYQDQSLFPHMTVRQNIAYPLRRGRKPDIALLAEKTGVTHLLDRSAATLSIGEAQRTALARALATRPKLLLLDEPMASLDVQAKASMRSLLRRLNNEGLTIIHVTHDYREAISLARRLAVMESGTLVQAGTPAEVLDHPKSEFIAGFTGIRNFYKGVLRRIGTDVAQFQTDGLVFDIATEEPDGAGYAMLRTQDISLSNTEPASSIRNHFKGVVIDIEPVRSGVEVTVDIGISATAVITQESMQSLGIELDRRIWVNFKATAARFLSAAE